MQRGNNRAEVFFSDEDRIYYLQTLVRYCAEFKLEIWAYCLMPNHVHLLAVPQRANSLAQGIGRSNLMYTQYVNRTYDHTGRLWQNRYFSCPVEPNAYLWSLSRYIEMNPVRARVAEHAWDYRWSSARHHVLGEPDLVVGGAQWLAPTSREQYRDYLEHYQTQEQTFEWERIRTATQTGRPLGGPDFIDKLEIKLGRILRPQKRGRKKRS
jgi:putative transposase